MRLGEKQLRKGAAERLSLEFPRLGLLGPGAHGPFLSAAAHRRRLLGDGGAERAIGRLARRPPRPRTTGGTPANTERKRLIALFGGEYSAPATERYLNEILARLAPATQTPSETYRVTILNSPIVNAFALPSGDIFVTRGLLALANDSSEIAAVMAHEIAHVTAQHAAKRAEKEKTAQLFARVSTAVLDRPEEGRGTGSQGPARACAILPPTGIRGRSDRHQDHRAGGL